MLAAATASLSWSRRRAPMTGTMSSPCAATHAIAICATVAPLPAAPCAARSTSARLRSTILALEARRVRAEIVRRRGRPCQLPPIRPRESTP